MKASTHTDLARLLLRVTLGLLILLHGMSKLNGGMSGIMQLVASHGLPAQLGYAVLLGEVVGPLMLIAGFHARIGAWLIFINMAVAIALVHLGQLGQLNDKGGWVLELQAMYLMSALALALVGPGRFSVNQR